MNNHDRIAHYYQSLSAKDWAAFASTLSSSVLYEVPQTRERIRGLESYLDFNATFPGDWTIEVLRIVANETGGSGLIRFFDEGQEFIGIAFFDIVDGLITHILDYWPEPYEPPKRYSQFIERY